MTTEAIIGLIGFIIQIAAFAFFMGGLSNRVSSLEITMGELKATQKADSEEQHKLIMAVSRLQGAEEQRREDNR